MLICTLPDEQSIPKDFLSYLFSNADDGICKASNKVFADTNDANYPANYQKKGVGPGEGGQSRLQTLFNYLPNFQNLAIIGMDGTLNERKGKLFNDKLKGFQSAIKDSGSTQFNLELWNQIGMLFEFLNMDVTHRVWSTVQDSMYAGWVRFDGIWEAEACDQEPLNFAKEYQSFMSTLLSTNAVSAQAWATAVSSVAVEYATTKDADGNTNAYGAVIANLQATFAPATLTWSTDPWLNFPQSTANIQRRGAACTANATTTASQTTATVTSASTSGTDSTTVSASTSGTNSTLVSASSSSASSTSSPTPTACSFVATVYPSSLQSIAGSGTQNYCQCGETMADINLATSGSSTTSYCAVGSPVPAGFSQIPASNGVAISTSTTSASSTTTSSATSTTAAASATASCSSELSTTEDNAFAIFGVGWDDTMLKTDGATLKTALDTCSGHKVDDWNIYWNTDSTPVYDDLGATGFDFKINGTMYKISECFDTAAKEAGGCQAG